MNFITVFSLAVALALDAMAVSVANGISLKKCHVKDALLMGLFFGGFQFLMPLLGFYLGRSVLSFIEIIDHYVAFVILAVIGGRMIWEAQKNDEEDASEKVLTIPTLIVQAIATSIDAFAVGVSIAFTGVNLYFSCAVIGIVAFVLSVFGALAGRRLGGMFKKWSTTIGGIVLIIIGTRFLIEHFFG